MYIALMHKKYIINDIINLSWLQNFETAFCAEHYTNTETILDPLFRLYFPSAIVQERL